MRLREFRAGAELHLSRIAAAFAHQQRSDDGNEVIASRDAC